MGRDLFWSHHIVIFFFCTEFPIVLRWKWTFIQSIVQCVCNGSSSCRWLWWWDQVKSDVVEFAIANHGHFIPTTTFHHYWVTLLVCVIHSFLWIVPHFFILFLRIIIYLATILYSSFHSFVLYVLSGFTYLLLSFYFYDDDDDSYHWFPMWQLAQMGARLWCWQSPVPIITKIAIYMGNVNKPSHTRLTYNVHCCLPVEFRIEIW